MQPIASFIDTLTLLHRYKLSSALNVMAANCFIFKWHLIVTFAFVDAEAGLIVNKIQSFAKNPVIGTDNINERYVFKAHFMHNNGLW